MIIALALEASAFTWLAAFTRPGVGYAVLLPALIMVGAGLPLFWAPIANASLSAARPDEQGQASGTATAVRELAIVLGVAVLASIFAAHGSYATPMGFIAGFRPAMWLAAGLATAGLLVTLIGPEAERSRAGVRPHRPRGSWGPAPSSAAVAGEVERELGQRCSSRDELRPL
jgi:hypothetical protein